MFEKKIAVYSKNQAQHMNAVYGRSTEILDIDVGVKGN
jgi:hypothetical protein